VPVLITNCHVSENPNKGPVTPQITIIIMAIINAKGLPVPLVTAWENLLKNLLNFFFLFLFMSLFLKVLKIILDGNNDRQIFHYIK
jgi:hypothetical protein